jgi:hypothetical protein
MTIDNLLPQYMALATKDIEVRKIEERPTVRLKDLKALSYMLKTHTQRQRP